MINNPFFIIGTERSGSNLLRLILNAHSQIAVPHPPHVMRDFSHFINLYGDLNQDAHFYHLIRDVHRSVRLHFSPWPFVPDEDEIYFLSPSRSLYGIYSALYEQYRLQQKKKRWGCKSTFMHRHLAEISQHHNKPLFIHLVRDPRDVAASAKRSVFSHYHPVREAHLWQEEQTAIENYPSIIKKNHLLLVRYEDLVSNPEKTMRKIMNFLGEEFEPQQMNYFISSEAKKLSSMMQSWRSVAVPINQDSVKRFERDLTEKEIFWVEEVTGHLMEKYGYSKKVQGRKKEFFRELYLIKDFNQVKWQERIYWLWHECQSLKTDKNFWQRWRKKIFLQYAQQRLLFQRKGMVK